MPIWLVYVIANAGAVFGSIKALIEFIRYLRTLDDKRSCGEALKQARLSGDKSVTIGKDEESDKC